jgi:hypothetical protein
LLQSGFLPPTSARLTLHRFAEISTLFSPTWRIRERHIIPQAELALLGELDEALTIVQRTAPVVASLRAATLTQEFTDFLEDDLLPKVANDENRQTVIIEAKQQLALA